MPKIATVSSNKPFAERLPAAFVYPLRGGALASCVALTLAHYVGLLPSLIGALGTLAVWAATWRYASDCMCWRSTASTASRPDRKAMSTRWSPIAPDRPA